MRTNCFVKYTKSKIWNTLENKVVHHRESVGGSVAWRIGQNRDMFVLEIMQLFVSTMQ